MKRLFFSLVFLILLLGCSGPKEQLPQVLNYSFVINDEALSISNNGDVELPSFYIEYTTKWFENIKLGTNDSIRVINKTYQVIIPANSSYALGDLSICLPNELWSESNIYKCTARLFNPASMEQLDKITYFYNFETRSGAYRISPVQENDYEAIRDFISKNLNKFK